MNEQSHIVSGIYVSRAEADSVRNRLDNETLKNVLIDSSVGAAVGTIIRGLSEVALIAANVTLFVASPVIATLFMLGWGASIGGFVGAAEDAETLGKTSENREGKLSELVLDAIRSGHVALIARTRTPAETTLTRELVGDSMVVCRH